MDTENVRSPAAGRRNRGRRSVDDATSGRPLSLATWVRASGALIPKMYFVCDAILFDVDGTLVDSRSAVERTWRLWAEHYGLDAAHVVRICHGRRTEDTVALLLPESEHARAIERLDERELLDLDDMAPMPGAARLLACLEESSWAIVTSCTTALARARLGAAPASFPARTPTGESSITRHLCAVVPNLAAA